MTTKSKRSNFTKEMLREAARSAHRRMQVTTLPWVVFVPRAAKCGDQAALDDRVAWLRASARARRRGLH